MSSAQETEEMQGSAQGNLDAGANASGAASASATKKKTPNEEQYRKIDFGIPVAAAELCKQNGINTLVIISSVGANEKSSSFYLRTKGEMENVLKASQMSQR